MYKSLSDSKDECNSGGAHPGSSQLNPFSRQGGTILLPALPAPGPSQHQASSSSMSERHTQMHGGGPSGRLKTFCLFFFRNSIRPYQFPLKCQNFCSFSPWFCFSFLPIFLYFCYLFHCKAPLISTRHISSKPTGPGHLRGHRPPPQISGVLPRPWCRGSRPKRHQGETLLQPQVWLGWVWARPNISAGPR